MNNIAKIGIGAVVGYIIWRNFIKKSPAISTKPATKQDDTPLLAAELQEEGEEGYAIEESKSNYAGWDSTAV